MCAYLREVEVDEGEHHEARRLPLRLVPAAQHEEGPQAVPQRRLVHLRWWYICVYVCMCDGSER